MSKPIGYIIDTSNPLAASLVFATVMDQGSGTPIDLVTAATGAAQGGATWTTMDNGDPGRIFTASTDCDYYAGLDSTGAGSALSLVVVSEATNGVASGGYMFSKADANAGLYDFAIFRSGADDTFRVRYSNVQEQSSGISATAKVFYGFAGDATSTFWNVDGSTATGLGITLASNQKRLTVGGRYLNPGYDSGAGNNSAGKGRISAAFWWNRKLSTSELATLQANPWAFLVPNVTLMGAILL